ncbi:hypothetical protein [Erythrobacter litoralis]|uniref:hypothetical protein n=1 Tax=Erythrobacter litoralis TaxID=39960 RepID=UPI0024355DA5|nr:hypothetical protein [Erythrobacter litoralis]
MNIFVIAAALAQAGAVPATAQTETVGYVELATGEDAAALTAIENSIVDEQDPALLINEGIALARLGMTDEAVARFEAAMDSPERVSLETATGEWVDSRQLARRGLRMVRNGEFQQYVAANAR